MSSNKKQKGAAQNKGGKKTNTSAAKQPVKQAAKAAPKKTFLQKLFPTLLLALAAPLTLCVFGPFDIYYGNMQEFAFSLGDFFPVMFLFALIIAAVIFSVLILLEGMAYDIGCAAVAGISLMFYIQRSYLNMGISSLAGDVDSVAEIGVGAYILNTAIWLLIVGGAVCAAIFLRKKYAETVNTVIVIAMVALIGMQLVSFGVVSMTSDVYVPVLERAENSDEDKPQTQAQPMVLTYENMGELSKGNNIVFFLVDRFDSNYYEAKIKAEPEYFNRLDGFTYFSDYTTLYCRTYPAVASILTGKDHDYFTKESKADKFAKFYGEGGGTMATLKENGYSINLYTEKSYVYTDAAVMDRYVDNTSGIDEYYIDSEVALAKDMLRLSMSQFLPLVAKNSVGYLSTPTFNSHAVYETEGEMFMVDENATEDLQARLEDTEFVKVDSEGQFTFIHLYGCHDTKQSSSENINETFDLIYYYIDQMKAMGIYDSSTIIITGDHAAALSDSKMIGAASSRDDGTRVTAMLFKKSGESGTALKTSSAQISQDELWNTIFESEGMTSAKTGDSFYEIPEGVDRERRYIFEMYKNSKNNDLKYNRVYEYKITGTAHDGANWEIVKETDIIK